MTSPGTLVIVPTYNERDNLPAIVKAVHDAFACDFLVIDDNSPDGTGALADEMAARDPRIRVMHRAGKLGLGTAYLEGFRFALREGYEFVFEMDADFSHDPSALPTLLDAAEDYEVVIGSRYVPGAAIPNWTLARLALSRGGNLYASLLLSLRVADSTAGFRVYRRSALERIEYQTVRADGYAFQIEMTYRARSSGASIKEVPITFIDRVQGSSKMSGAIVVEALGLVTLWAVQRPLRALRAMLSGLKDPQH